MWTGRSTDWHCYSLAASALGDVGAGWWRDISTNEKREALLSDTSQESILSGRVTAQCVRMAAGARWWRDGLYPFEALLQFQALGMETRVWDVATCLVYIPPHKGVLPCHCVIQRRGSLEPSMQGWQPGPEARACKVWLPAFFQPSFS